MPTYTHTWDKDGFHKKEVYDDPISDGLTWGTKMWQAMDYFGVIEFFTPDTQENVICIFEFPFAYVCLGERVIDPKIVIAECMKIVRDPVLFILFQKQFRDFLIGHNVSHAVGDEKSIKGPKTI